MELFSIFKSVKSNRKKLKYEKNVSFSIHDSIYKLVNKVLLAPAKIYE